MPSKIAAFGINTNLTETDDFAVLADTLATNTKQSVFFCNTHMLMLSQEDAVLANAMDNADWVFADSAPVAWLQRRISNKDAKVIPGYKVVQAICERAAKLGEKVGFMGSTPEVMNGLVENLTAQFEGLPVTYRYCPPFMPDELLSTEEELLALKDSGIQWLFVGLGCPKQEKWIARYGSQLHCHALAVGAAFDWLSGAVKKPPDWMERFGLAWLYRLLHNPRRMWSRYLIYNTKFIIRTSVFLIRGK